MRLYSRQKGEVIFIKTLQMRLYSRQKGEVIFIKTLQMRLYSRQKGEVIFIYIKYRFAEFCLLVVLVEFFKIKKRRIKILK